MFLIDLNHKLTPCAMYTSHLSIWKPLLQERRIILSRQTSLPSLSLTLKSSGGTGDWAISHDAPHMLLMLCHELPWPCIWTREMEPRLATFWTVRRNHEPAPELESCMLLIGQDEAFSEKASDTRSSDLTPQVLIIDNHMFHLQKP